MLRNLALGIVVVSLPVVAQADWQQVPTTVGPNAPFHTAMCFDVGRGVTVLFGGTDNAQNYGETWEFDGTAWVQATPAASPAPRWWARMAYDIQRGVCVLFGGNGNNAETWEYDGTTWTQRLPATVPPGRAAQAMWYDVARQRVMMFGGTTSQGLVNDTWAWDGTDWTQLQPANAPQPLFSIEAAYDLARDRAVLFGGAANNGGTVPVDETWEWDGADWTQIVTPTTPRPRWGNKVAYHVDRQRVVMSGGVDRGAVLDDTWEFDGYEWHQITTASTYVPRENHAMAYDLLRGRCVVYGGFPPIFDTWEYVDRSPARFVPYGYGCAGSNGTPGLDAAPGLVPTLGQAFTMDLTNLPSAATFAFVLVGSSKTSNGGIPLPFDLSALGLTGCVQWIGDMDTSGVPAFMGTAAWNVTIPNDPNLIGYAFYVQGAVPDPGTNRVGFVVTNAGEGVIR